MASKIEERELVVVGGGPAGMAAAIEARRAGAQVTLVEERATLGGQIYKQPPLGFEVKRREALGKEYRAGRELIQGALECGAEILTDHVVWSVWGRDTKEVSLYQQGQQARTFLTTKVILATGAYDRPVPFPGWTLPGVISAGGAQSMVKVQKVYPGSRILLAGSGPLVLAFAVQLHQMGARVVAVLEAAPAPGPGAVARLLAAGAAGNLEPLVEGIAYLAYLRRHGIPLLFGHAIARAEGEREVERAVAVRVDRTWRPIPGTERTFEVDTVCVGYGFFPSVEIARTLGCALVYDEQSGGHVPRRSEDMETSVPGVFAAGDGSGVAGSAVALEEGRIAGIAAARQLGKLSWEMAAKRLAASRRRLVALGRFRDTLNAIYQVGQGIYEWATVDTIVCRCEDVTLGEVRRFIPPGSRDPNYVKSLTRVGMGLCQGRNCSRQVSYVFARETGRLPELPPLSSRPPVKPVPIGLIADTSAQQAPNPCDYDLALAEPPRGAEPSSSVDETDVLIIGGGIVGCACAYYLTKEKVEWLVVDRGELHREGSGTNPGSLHIQLRRPERLYSDEVLREFVPLKIEAARMWADIERELGCDLGVKLRGGFLVAETDEEYAFLREMVDFEGTLGLETALLSTGEMLRISPHMSDKLKGAAYNPTEGYANTLLVGPTYAHRAMQAGARFRTYTDVIAIDCVDGGGFQVTTSTGKIRAKRILNAAGPWAGQVSAKVGVPLPVGGRV
ncbi:MAG TPA: FAD-dependent oxidoreductase, partial [bacterium]|nr:FAD-dependent oxidoreductase [bacterium]